MEPGVTRKPRRRWLQFRLRSLVLATTIFGVLFGLYMQRVRQQKQAVQAIRDFGGSVHYDYQERATGWLDEIRSREDGSLEFDLSAKPPVPEWLLSALGEDFFFDVVDVNLTIGEDSGKIDKNTNVTNWALPYLNAFPNLRQLYLTDGQARDDDLCIIGDLKTLESVSFFDADRITDAGVSHLSRLPKLERICLTFSQIGDEGVRVLAQLPRIQFINVQGGHFTDRGLEFLKDKGQLRELSIGLGPTTVTDAGLRHLRGLINLEVLDLRDTEITDNGLVHLKGLTKLKYLVLCNTQITDTGLKQLVELKRLKDLFLAGTRATGNEFKTAVPGCNIYR